MIRKIIHIDRERCNGCGACVTACHEGAIELLDGKAHLAREDYCDGLGDCLPACPTGAITFETREAPAYNEIAVHQAKQQKQASKHSSGCPGAAAKPLPHAADHASAPNRRIPGRLMQWPCQIKLIPQNALYLEDADLLIAADCTAYAYGSLHNDFMKGRITMIGCPKLDAVDYTEKLTRIFTDNRVRSVTVVRMEVPCCSALERAARNAVAASGREIPYRVAVITTDGKILE